MPAQPLGFQQCQELLKDRMPAASIMTGGRALLLCTNTENCIYQSENGIQCCGLQLEDTQSVVSHRPDLSRVVDIQVPLTSLDNTDPFPGNINMPMHKRQSDTHPVENGLGGCNKSTKNPVGIKSTASIRDKISQWEGKTDSAGPNVQTVIQKETESVRKKDVKTAEVQRKESKKGLNSDRQDIGKENGNKIGESWKGSDSCTRERDVILDKVPFGKTDIVQDKKSVLTHIKKLELAMKETPTKPSLPGNYFCPPSKDKQEEAEKKTAEPIFGSVEVVRAGSRCGRNRDPENVYTEPGNPSINPLPKPQRTFQHHTQTNNPRPPQGSVKGRRNLPPLPSIPPPPLPSCPPPPGVCQRPRQEHTRDSNNRKSYEFEDLLQSSTEGCRVDWYAQSKLGLTHTLSEENVYEDILDPPSKENPYEDIELESRCVGNKYPVSLSPTLDIPTKLSSKPGFFRQSSERRSFKLLDLRKTNRDGGFASPSRISPPSTPSSPDDTPSLSGDPYNRRRRKIPKMVLKINGIFEARRGKKKMKRVSQSTESSSGRVTDENSESESDTEEKLKAHSQRLVSVQSMLKQMGRYRTLERDLMDLQERKLFEYFLVVALHKTKAGAPYLPEVTQQFPLKLERSFKFMREAEDQLKVIPQFCFPDAKDWAPVDNFPSETFSFVLTGEDGSRRFGYCRRLLPSGKGRRLPEVYCIVSRLGCFDLFSKMLDEVEKRRAISPALVQPFMRGIMEAPFPAPGRMITVKNFLPGSGTEVIELCRPSDSRLEHVDFECLFSSLSLRLLLRVFASLLLERRVIFTADKLSTLSQCCHAVVALLYPFTWQHTYIPVLPPAMMDIVCTPTPFIVGLLSSSLPRLKELPLEEVLVVDLGNSRFLRQMDDEDSVLPHKLQTALEYVLEKRKELASDRADLPTEHCSLSAVVSEAFVRFFVEIVGHYSLFMGGSERDEESSASSSSPTPLSFQREAFRKAVSSKSLRRFLEVFMETQMFAAFIQEREVRRQGLRGLFEDWTAISSDQVDSSVPTLWAAPPSEVSCKPPPPTTTLSAEWVSASSPGGASEELSEALDKPLENDAEGVWSPDIEQSFQEALAIYPPCGRRKIILSDEGKMYGRNELIARYIKLRTGKTRTRKQVSSHIQVLARRKAREIQVKLKDQAAKDKALQSMANMSSAQIISPTAFQNKMALQSLSRPAYPTAGGFWHGALPGQPAPTEDIKPFSQQNYVMQATGPSITGYESASGLSMSPSAPPWQGRSIASSKLRMLEFSAFLEQPQDPENFNKHLFVHIGQSNPTYSDPYLEAVDIRQIYDKFPEKKGGLKELFEKGPANAFFLVKFWADLSLNLQDDSSFFYGVSSQYESSENMIITSSTKVCSFGKQVVEKVETEYARFENGRYVFRIHRSPLCEYMINFIHKLKHLPEKYMMNSVLENFTILQ
ncbi:DENN domain-containing protein 2A, partial [Clarias magur]